MINQRLAEIDQIHEKDHEIRDVTTETRNFLNNHDKHPLPSEVLKFGEKLERERDYLQKKNVRLNEWLDDYIQDKKQIGRLLGLSEENSLVHDMQKNVIFAIRNALRSDKPAYEQLNEIRKILTP